MKKSHITSYYKQNIIYKLDLLLSNRTKNFILETVEQLFTLKIIQRKNVTLF